LAFTLGSTYELSFSNGLSLSPSVEAQYSDSYYSQPTESPYSLQSSAWRFNAGLTFRSRNDAWEVALIGRNLTNVLRVITAFDLPLTGSGTGTTGPALRADLAGSVSDPRAILLQFKITDAVFR
jgi:iron complex outermembrane receptor protein